MRAPFAFRRFIVAVSTLLCFASSLALLAPDDASGAESDFAAWVLYTFYSDASHTTQVGQTHVNAGCNPGQTYSTGTQTPYYTAQVVHPC